MFFILVIGLFVFSVVLSIVNYSIHCCSVSSECFDLARVFESAGMIKFSIDIVLHLSKNGVKFGEFITYLVNIKKKGHHWVVCIS